MLKTNVKLSFLIAMLLSNILAGQRAVTFSPKLSIDLVGVHTLSVNGQDGSVDVNNSASVGIEAVLNSKGIFRIGGGAMYLFSREPEIDESAEFYFVPIYVLCQLLIVNVSEGIIPSLIANLGYNAVLGGKEAYVGSLNLSGGLYFAGGVRVSTDKIFMESIYKSFSGSASIEFRSESKKVADIKYSELSFGIGLLL